MQLVINNPDKLDLADFCKWLLPYIRDDIVKSIVREKCLKRDATIYDLGIIQFEGKQRRIPTETLIKQASLCITWKKVPNSSYYFYIDKRRTLYGSTTTIDTIVRLIEFGTEGVDPMPIFRPVFKSFEENIQEWYDMYVEEEQ